MDKADTPPDYSPFVIGIVRFICHLTMPVFYSYKKSGLENIPAEGAALITPNHASYLDPVFISYSTRRPVYYLAWHRLFANGVFGKFLGKCGGRSVNIDNPSDRTAWRAALDILQAGHLLCVFPEGKRSHDGSLNPFQAGAFRLAAQSNSPIVPAWIEGSFESWPRTKRLPRIFSPVKVMYQPQIHPKDAESSGRRAVAAELLAKTRDSLLAVSRNSFSIEPENTGREIEE